MPRNSNGHRLLIFDTEFKEYGIIISKKLPYVKIFSSSSTKEASKIIQSIEIILSWEIPNELLMQAKNLQWFASTGGGNEHLVNNPYLSERVILTKPTVYGQMMTEYIFTYILYFSQNLDKLFENQNSRIWDRNKPMLLSEKIIGIIGLGSIGKEIAKRAKQFGMNVLGVKRNVEPTKNVDRVFGPENLNEVIPQVDYLVMVVPLTSETYHMFGEKELKLMKDGAIFFNIGRGKTVDEKALVKILNVGKIKAVIDVFETEPLPVESELWSLENVIITPHISGITPIEEVCEEFILNYERWKKGQILQGVVDRQKGY